MNIIKELSELGVDLSEFEGDDIKVFSPIDGSMIASVRSDTEIESKIVNSHKAFEIWRDIPAPKRGKLIRLFGEQLRRYKEPLARLVTIECGKIIEEGRGEVQEMIDICDFATGLSRQLYGLTIASERFDHTLEENWLPIGTVGVISAFNFPVAVWAWNFTLSVVCGNSVIWKPSEKTPLTAIACQAIFEKALTEYKYAPENLSQIIIGKSDIGNMLVEDKRIPLISATGSCRMGKIVAPKVAERFGKSLLELGGNNCIIVTENADINLAVQSILFGAVSTCGQRCTSTRRILAKRSIYDKLFEKLKTAYESIAENKVGNPLNENTLVGPLIDEDSYLNMQAALNAVKQQGGEIFFGKRRKELDGYYINPALVKIEKQSGIVLQETFAPILYVIPYDDFDEAISLHNAVSQGLSSAIFTTDLREAAYFKKRSDCGIVNVNIGTSGAEIGGAFGGEKETGGGREAGSDSWKNYMRRQTSTTFYGMKTPELAQGINFPT